MPTRENLDTRSRWFERRAASRAWWLGIALGCCAVPALASDLRRDIAAELRSQGLQGAVWSIVDGDAPATVDAVGVRDARDGSLLEPHHRVHVGSIAKTLLATGILQFVGSGRLALDAPVSEVLPDVRFDNPWAPDHPVRVRHLLDHTAGLDDARFSQVFSLEATPDMPLAQAFGDRPVEVRSVPGARNAYSNTSYALLGMILESLAQERYETYLARELLQPLGMHDSTFSFTTQDGPGADRRLAMGHFERGVTQAAVPMALRPAGQFTTTAGDMATFARFLMGDGQVAGRRVLDPLLLQTMGIPYGTEAAIAGLRVGYALGLSTRDRHGVVGKCHGGSTIGFQAMLCVFPEHQRAWFHALNADSEGADYGRFERLLVEAMGLARTEPAAEGPSAVAPDHWAGYYVPAPNRFAAFEWLDTTLNGARARSVESRLGFRRFQMPEVVLVPVGGSLYRAPDRVIASHVALVASDGKRVISTGTQTFREVSLGWLAVRWISLGAGLLGLATLLLLGTTRLVRGRGRADSVVMVPYCGILALLLPVPFFLAQSFLALGDPTLAGLLLALVTCALPVTMVAGLALAYRRRRERKGKALELAAMVAVLQLTIVLAAHGLVPLRLYA